MMGDGVMDESRIAMDAKFDSLGVLMIRSKSGSEGPTVFFPFSLCLRSVNAKQAVHKST